MKVLTLMKKNKLIVFVALLYIIVLIVDPQKAADSISNSMYYLGEMLQVLPIIFLLTVVIEAWVPKEVIMKSLGDKSGIKGNLLSLLLGSISAGPIYAAFPIGKSLLSKGASITNIVIILSAWAVIKVPMLANEAKFLGLEFMAVRWILTVISIVVMGYLISIFVKKKDIPDSDSENKENTLIVNEDYCTGCGLCYKMLPKYYEMNDNKAIVKSAQVNNEDIKKVIETVEKCPARAIVYESKKDMKH